MTVKIQISKGYAATVDDIDGDLAATKWSAIERTHTTYARRYSKGGRLERRTVSMHRVILQRTLGRELLPSEDVDHIDGDGLNNTRANLRAATRSQNMRNIRHGSKCNSGLRGVIKRCGGTRWDAVITVNYKQIYLGSYKSIEEASYAYKEAARRLFGEFFDDGMVR